LELSPERERERATLFPTVWERERNICRNSLVCMAKIIVELVNSEMVGL
jgi:hypothetical protein